MAWDWFVLDIAYVLVLVGGAVVLRSRNSTLLTWVFFGLLSVSVGGFLFASTYVFQTAQAASTQDAVAMLNSC